MQFIDAILSPCNRWDDGAKTKKKKRVDKRKRQRKKKKQRGETRLETGDEETTSHANHTREGKKKNKKMSQGEGEEKKTLKE